MKKSRLLLATVPLLAALTACGGGAQDDGRTSVIASSYPFAFVAERVGGSAVNVSNLTAPGTEPHDLELKPKQVASVQDADLVIYQKDFQAAVDQAVEQAGRSDDDTIDVASLVKLLPNPSEEGEHHADDGHDHGDADPHTWLDPRTMIALTEAVQAELSSIDPEHAADYRANADQLVDELTALDEDFSAGLRGCRTRTIVTSHAAFQYLAARYGLEQVAIAGLDPTNEPSPSQLGDISRLVRAEKITTIFTEELVSPAIANTIAKETGATTATLDPIEGLSDQTKDETYLTLMRRNLDTLKKANSCQ
ncbi:metal ABC transporter substrate-binding protein [Aeromicrobium wangtongii]|uniref:Metal ABC transporter substrate-binding protein n=1 Tax=Aeromicrobium wangtongii TaxID=2969247 RepID=A0ABY5M9U1_9ACTN|nr:metal ABC transporter substrate-binding protein [Aeromicrobium wangtongii]MCD9198525.1 metal ABC transporter substrate-binding protein [Aeromicrobium wangtongii]UUP12551.1 metal ABC transporter substrate-binding protein [Aeromicrobium wangtongii]